MKSPIFILSLPRSGSTLLQRVLTQHVQIASVSEPWILLPLVYSQKPTGVLAEFSHRNSQLAINDLVNALPKKQKDYDAAIQLMAESIYQKLCKNDEIYFLDKTPRYHLIAEDLIRIFPEAKFIFLFRNPMDIYASVMKTWGENTFKKLYTAENDLNEGFKNLYQARKKLGDSCLVINYEDFVANTNQVLLKVSAFLNVDNKFGAQEELVQFDGQLGDQVGVKKYNKISSSSVGNWKMTFNTSFRKKEIRRYMSSLDEEILKILGYDKKDLLKSIGEHKVKFRFSVIDRFHIVYYKLAKLLNGHLLLTDVYKWARKKYLS